MENIYAFLSSVKKMIFGNSTPAQLSAIPVQDPPAIIPAASTSAINHFEHTAPITQNQFTMQTIISHLQQENPSVKLSPVSARRSLRFLPSSVFTAILVLLGMAGQVSAQNVNVTATAGTLTGSYATISAAFAAINGGTHQGDIILDIVNNTTEPGAVTNLLRSATPSNYTSVLIRPIGNRTVSGTATTNRSIIELNGADNVTIDGDDPNTAGSRNLTFQYSATSTNSCAVIRFGSTINTDASNGADKIVVKNCVLIGSRTINSTTTTVGFAMSNFATASVTGAAAASCDSIILENNQILRVSTGMFLFGSSLAPCSGVKIRNNVLGDGTNARNIGATGMLCGGLSYPTTPLSQRLEISGNDIQLGMDKDTTGYTSALTGISLQFGVEGAQVFNNKIHDIKSTGSSATSTSGGANGIVITNIAAAAGGNNISIYNNFIYRISSASVSTTVPTTAGSNGIFINSTAVDVTNLKIDHNTILISPASRFSAVSNPGTAFSSAVTNLSTAAVISSFRNNILTNYNEGANPYLFYTAATTNISAGAVDNNVYYYPSTSLNARVGYYSSANAVTLAAWQIATGKDAAAYFVNPPFTSQSDPHLSNALPTLLESAGSSAVGITTDIDGQSRPGPAGSVNGAGTAPDIGADEFDGIQVLPLTMTSVSADPPVNQCTATARNITAIITQGTNPVDSAKINYAINGVAQTPISMVNSATNTWTGTIPAATPTNAFITWSVTGFDAATNKSLGGTAYQDDALNGVSLAASATPASVCNGSTTVLNSSAYSATPATYSNPPAVTNPTADEDLGNVTISFQGSDILNNTTAVNSLVGSIGTATGLAGSFSDFTAVGSYALSAGQTYQFSLSSISAGGSYTNSMAIYIDYNRDGDFTDAGEQVYNPGATTGTGPHTVTGSFTIPATSFNGLTRMRVLCNEGAITGPTMAISWGEREDYLLNISSSNFGGGQALPAVTYSWTLNGTTIASTQSTTQTITASGTYTAVVTTVNGGCTISNPVNVTVLALPPAPDSVTRGSDLCGTANPGCKVSGLAGNSFNWYLTPTGGSPIPGAGNADTLAESYTINTTTTFYIAQVDAATGCESGTRTSITVTVFSPDPIEATTASGGSICLNANDTLKVSNIATSPTALYSYVWRALGNAVNAGLEFQTPAGQAGSVPILPLVAGTYKYEVTAVSGVCLTIDTATLIVKSLPVISFATAEPDTTCAFSPVALEASTPITLSSERQIVGVGFSQNTVSANIQNGNWNANKSQFIYAAADLQAAGFVAGNISGLTFLYLNW